ncbi:MAG TPA: hypothetical protein VFD37_06195, partial [Solirubrobacterales bacterium]|nr:hypothetical protein [Solirubrobacterales bacterium]
MTRKLTTLLLGALLALCAMPAAAAAEFGFAEINTGLPGDPDVPAYPSTDAVFAGTCDLSSDSTTDGGVGSHNGGSEPPAIRAHCVDPGDSSVGAASPIDVPWPPGSEPDWRLDPVTQAGAHPDGTAAFWFRYLQAGFTDGAVKDIIVKLPPGVVGNPEAVVKCSALEAQATPPACPASAQVGISTLGFPANIAVEVNDFQTRPVYVIEARDTVTAELLVASIAGYFNVPITARGRTNGDYGVDTLALLIPQFTPLGGQSFTFWGVPWAAEHDKFRAAGLDAGLAGSPPSAVFNGFEPVFRVPYDPDDPAFQDASGSPLPIKPFFTNPTECSGEPLPVEVQMDSWQDPVSRGGEWVRGVSEAPPVSECDQLEFDPAIALKPTVQVSDSPSGLDVT